MLEHTRRATDNQSLDISQMIADENDPKQRAFLIVLHNINLSLLANTQTIQDIRVKFESHMVDFASHAEDEARLINQGKGAWKVIAWVVGIVQAGALAMWIDVNAGMKENTRRVIASDLIHQQYDSRITILEQK